MGETREKGGCLNESADSVKREDKTWSDMNLDREFDSNDKFTRLKCRNCGGLNFEVIQTSEWETSAKCINCNMYYIAHSG